MRSAAAEQKQLLDTFRQMATQQQLKKAPGPALDLSLVCKADPSCRNAAVWFNTDLQIQYCEKHPVEGKRRTFKRKQHPTAAKDDNDSS